MKNVVLALAFLLELVAFTAFSCLGLLAPLSPTAHVVLFVALVAILITFWGLFMVPKAAHKFKAPAYYFSKLIIYGLAALVLWVKLGVISDLVFAACVIADEAVLFRHNLS